MHELARWLADLKDDQQPDWAEVLQDYATSSQSIASLCRRHNVSRSSFYRHLKQSLLGGASEMLPRLMRALENKMSKFEERLQNTEPLSPADHEREARTLHSLLRMFERVTALSEREKPQTQKGRDANADTLRAELAARLDRLRERGRAAASGSRDGQ